MIYGLRRASFRKPKMTKTKNPLQIIGLVGPAGAGKSAVAKILANTHGYRIAPMAGPLKKMLIAGGLSHEDVYGAHKERPSPLLGGATPRRAMQTLGTEWGRDLIHPDIWVNMWTDAYEKVCGGSAWMRRQPLVADDVRFENEVAAIKQLGGTIVEVKRPHYGYGTGHRSEGGLAKADRFITNAGDLDLLQAQVDIFLGPSRV